MPELPEVERAADVMTNVGGGKTIEQVETTEDSIVYAGTTHQEFASEITGRTFLKAVRYGKVFYLQLDGEGRMPVLHFGMTGAIHVEGGPSMYYRKKPVEAEPWPPRFMKFILHLRDKATNSITKIAFMDARRLGRIRLCASPANEPPISALGFDPILSMPKIADFQTMVLRRTCPIKALLLDQTFSAGVGNYVADEILHLARVHPEQKCNLLTESQVAALHLQTSEVCRIAVEAKADDTKYPENWLFKHRWGKGKKEKHNMKLPDGKPATIKWVTVGGRTSAYVAELQHLSSQSKAKVEDDNESDLTALTDSDAEAKAITGKGQKRKAAPKTSTKARVVRRKGVAVEEVPST